MTETPHILVHRPFPPLHVWPEDEDGIDVATADWLYRHLVSKRALSKMASTYDLFKRLTSGVKFNKKKFKDDFEKLKVILKRFKISIRHEYDQECQKRKENQVDIIPRGCSVRDASICCEDTVVCVVTVMSHLTFKWWVLSDRAMFLTHICVCSLHRAPGQRANQLALQRHWIFLETSQAIYSWKKSVKKRRT